MPNRSDSQSSNASNLSIENVPDQPQIVQVKLSAIKATKIIADKQADKAEKVQQQVNEVVDLMQKNVERVMARGEKLDSLQSKTEDLSAAGFNFKKSAVKVESEMWWKNMKLGLIAGGLVVTCATIGVIYYTRTQ